MTVGLDTSVVLRLLTGEPPEQAEVALSDLRSRLGAGERVLVGDWVLAEAYYALQHHYGAPKREVLVALRGLVTDSGVEVRPYVAPILRRKGLSTAKPGFVDRLVHGGYESDGARLVTFEQAASRLQRAIVLGG